jgi:hypothetical protein
MIEYRETFGPRVLEGELTISDFNEWAQKYQVSTLHVESTDSHRMDYYRDKLSIIQDHEPITLKKMLIIASHEVRDNIIDFILNKHTNKQEYES